MSDSEKAVDSDVAQVQPGVLLYQPDESPTAESVESGHCAVGESTTKLSTFRMAVLASMMMMTYFLGVVSGQAALLNIPKMASDLSISELKAQWVVSAYNLSYGCGLLFLGRLADVFGGKISYLTGLAVFCLFSISSAVMKAPLPLFVMRALSALGVALAGPAGYGIIGQNITHEPARTITFAAFGLGGPIGSATGSLLGGAVAGISAPGGWAYLFYILAGLGAIPLTIGVFAIPRDIRRYQKGTKLQLDYLGGFLITASLSLFMFSLTQSGIVENGWTVPYVPALLVTSLVLLVLFLLYERYLENHTTRPPCLKFSLFTRHRGRITVLLACACFVGMSVQGFVYVATIWYQYLEHTTALENAILLLPCNIMGLAAAASTMYLTPRYRASYLIAVGAVMSGVTSLLYASIPSSVSYWAGQFIAQLFLPWGIDLTICVGNVLIVNLVDSDEQSVGGALFQTSACIGIAMSTCLSGLLIAQGEGTDATLNSALRHACWMNFAFAMIVPFIALVGLRGIGLAKDARETLQPALRGPSKSRQLL